MLRLRILAGTACLLFAVAMVASGCSGTDDDVGQAAAAQVRSATILQVSSPSFTETRPRVRIPAKHTCVGEDVSPPLEWSGVPEGTKSLALIAEDPDHEAGLWVHWVMYNMPADLTGVPEGVPTSTAVLPDGTTQGSNDHKRTGYSGPCPPAEKVPYPGANVSAARHAGLAPMPPHQYYFRLYALDTELALAPGATKDELVTAMYSHILAEGETVGKYLRPPDPFD